jgi:hypothetical protein
MTTHRKPTESFPDHHPAPKVDPQSGRTRLWLLLIFILILWSLLATIVSYENPLPTLLGTGVVSSAGQTASSIGNFLSDYFSVFSLLNLAMLLLAGLLGFRQVRSIVADELQLSQPRKLGSYLRNCAFSMATPFEMNPLAPDFSGSDDHKLVAAIGGPAYIQLDPQHAALIRDANGNLDILLSDTQDQAYPLDYQEKFLEVIPAREQEYSLSLTAICEDGLRVKIKGLRVAVSNPFSVNKPNPDEALISSDFAEGGMAFFPGTDWEAFAKEILQMETKAFLLSHSSQEIHRQIMLSEPGAHDQTAGVSRIAKAHTIVHRTASHLPTESLLRRNNPALHLRNRRRSIMPELHAEELVAVNPLETSLDLQGQLQDYLSRSFKVIYNNAIIDPQVIHLGDISFDGTH